MNALDELLSSRTQNRRRGCFVCGADTEAYVTIRIQRLNDSGSNSGVKGEGKSASRSFCGQHAVDLYGHLVVALEQKR